MLLIIVCSFATITSIGFVALMIVHLRGKKQAREALTRFSAITDLEAELSRLRQCIHLDTEETVKRQTKAANRHAQAMDAYANEHDRTIQGYRQVEATLLEEAAKKRVALASEYEVALQRYAALKAEITVGVLSASRREIPRRVPVYERGDENLPAVIDDKGLEFRAKVERRRGSPAIAGVGEDA